MKSRARTPNPGTSGGIPEPKSVVPEVREATGISVELPSLRFRINSILVPIDFSDASKEALAYAVPLAAQFAAKLTILHVVEPVATPDFAKSFPLALDSARVLAACRRRLRQIVKEQQIDPKLVEAVFARPGRSYHEITEAARTLDTDLIIIATHGYTGLKHALLGSTTERVVRHAPCPVLVVRERKREFV